ncbi:spermidine synthase [Marinobacter sp. X15-166B]|uniref:spermidine synthase n=1 Tax=Marinobacter sp. X15-166B TaxID=1897620 RepID=UPI00085CD78A|nr:methyltransferase domain-containing protein [Marinobacter sp. X15-166B]OEY67646.1 spermidine synthase [Marinobacter sp. X15-166B]
MRLLGDPKSFFDGEIIEHRRDAMGPIQVVDFRRHRVLNFASIFEQSKIDRRQPYLPVHEYNRAMFLPIVYGEPTRVTVLGLGGGVMVSGLSHLLPESRIHAVELRQEVLNVAREYFSMPDTDNINVTIADARHALAAMEDASTDLIMADLYDANRMSTAQSGRRFVENCSRVLSDTGWLVINYHEPPEQNGPVFRQLRAHFSSLFSFQSKTNNTIIYCSRQPVELVSPAEPRFDVLEGRLPIGWRSLMKRMTRLSRATEEA